MGRGLIDARFQAYNHVACQFFFIFHVNSYLQVLQAENISHAPKRTTVEPVHISGFRQVHRARLGAHECPRRQNQ